MSKEKSEILKTKTLTATAGDIVFGEDPSTHDRIGQLVMFRVGNKTMKALVSCPQADREAFIKPKNYKGAYVIKKERYAGRLQYTGFPEGAVSYANSADEDDGF